MSDFDDVFADAMDDLLDTFGSDTLYIPQGGDAIPLKAALNENREVMGGDYQSSFMAITFTFKAGLVNEINRGDAIEHSGKTYYVEAPLSEDSHAVEVIVK